jgi:hypothetical protein
MDRSAREYYVTDPIGKCLRHASIKKDESGQDVFGRDIHLCMKDSDTYAAFVREDRIGERFNKARAIPGELRWKHAMKPFPKDDRPHPVLLDDGSGVFFYPEKQAYGCASDVRHCFYFRSASGEWQQLP